MNPWLAHIRVTPLSDATKGKTKVLNSTDDLKDMPHIVVMKTASGCQLFEYEGLGCMEKAHEFAAKLAVERLDACVLVAMRYRRITGPDAPVI